jgi:hypothetical protein
MSVVASENNDVMLFREVNCKMLLFAMKYAILNHVNVITPKDMYSLSRLYINVTVFLQGKNADVC